MIYVLKKMIVFSLSGYKMVEIAYNKILAQILNLESEQW